MKRLEKQPVIHSEHKKPRGEKRLKPFANGHVRPYDSFDPRLIIDLMEDGKQVGKIIADSYPLFETHTFINLDKIEIIRAHHKARLVFQIGNSLVIDGVLKHEVFSPDGLVGYAQGDNLDFYIASLFYDDPAIKELAEKGQGSFDESVQAYIEQEFGIPGLFKK